MANTIKYYNSSDIIAYPCSNATDDGKLNIEDNMSSIVTRITNRNYALTTESFKLEISTNSGAPVIDISSGQANINGYHIITTKSLLLPPPQNAGTDLAICFKLARDSSNHVLGDVYNVDINEFNGLWVSYFNLDEAKKNPDTLILGTVDWNGNQFSNLKPNQDILARIDGETIILNIDDPKHPEYTTITLQELMDKLKDWYVSKDGDDEYGSILFKTSRDDKDYGISIHAIDKSNSEILIKPISSKELSTQLRLGANSTNPYIKLASSVLSTTDNNLLISSTQDTTINSKRNALIMSSTSTTINTDKEHTIESIVNKDSVIFQKDTNTKKHKFDIDNTGLYYTLGSLKFSYINNTNRGLIDGVTGLTITPDTTFGNNVTVTNKLSIGTNNKTYITNTQFVLENGIKSTIDGTGMKILQNGSTTTPTLSIYNTNSSMKTDIIPGIMKVTGVGSGIEFVDASLGTVSLKRSNTSNDLNLVGGLNATGNITANKVFNAVYNGIGEIFEKSKDEDIEYGDVVCVRDDGLIHKVSSEKDILSIVGICSDTIGYLLGGKDIPKDRQIEIEMMGQIWVKTDEKDIIPGQLLKVTSDGKVSVTENKEEKFAIALTNVQKDGERKGKVRVLYNG